MEDINSRFPSIESTLGIRVFLKMLARIPFREVKQSKTRHRQTHSSIKKIPHDETETKSLLSKISPCDQWSCKLLAELESAFPLFHWQIPNFGILVFWSKTAKGQGCTRKKWFCGKTYDVIAVEVDHKPAVFPGSSVFLYKHAINWNTCMPLRPESRESCTDFPCDDPDQALENSKAKRNFIFLTNRLCLPKSSLFFPSVRSGSIRSDQLA